MYPVTAKKNIQRSGKMAELLDLSRYLSRNLVNSLNLTIFMFYFCICGQIFKLQIKLVVFVETSNFHQSIQYDLYYHKIHRSSHLKEIVGVLDCLIAVNIIRIH